MSYIPPLDEAWDAVSRGVLPAALAAGSITACGLIPAIRRFAMLIPPLALLAGLALGHWLRDNPLPFVPSNPGFEWIFAATGAACVLGVLVSMSSWLSGAARLVLGLAPQVAACGLAAYLIMPADATGLWGLIGLAVVLAILSCDSYWQASRADTGEVALIWSLMAGAGSYLILLAHSARFADSASIAAGALGAVAVVCWLGRISVIGLVPPAVVYVLGLLYSAKDNTYSDVPAICFYLLAAAPLLAAILRIPAVDQKLPSWRGVVVRLAAVLVPMIAAVGTAMAYETLL